MNAPTWIYSREPDGRHRLDRKTQAGSVTMYFEKTAKPRAEEFANGAQVILDIRPVSFGVDAQNHGTYYVFAGIEESVDPSRSPVFLLRRVWTTNAETRFPTQHLEESVIGTDAATNLGAKPGDFCSVSIRKAN